MRTTDDDGTVVELSESGPSLPVQIETEFSMR